MSTAAVGPDTTDPSVGDLVAAWLPTQRWFPAGRADVGVEPWLAVTFDDAGTHGGADGDGVQEGGDALILLVRITGAAVPGGSAVVQVPLVLVPVEGSGGESPSDGTSGPGHIGTVPTRDGAVAVHDGAAHPACWATILQAMGVDDTHGAPTRRGRVLAGEQSNTSVILPELGGPSGPGGMLKILRTVVTGRHPDVVVPGALTDAGWDGVPHLLGALTITTPDGDAADLAILAELVPDAADGFELACDHAARGESFAGHAAALGRLVAELHAALAGALPTGPALDPVACVAGLRRRAAAALVAAPALRERTGPITAVLDDLEQRLVAAGTVPTQAVHGDLHLGQTLLGSTGWKVIDFEGEPQRPVGERTAADLPPRDVAGMLRSLDYAAAIGGAPDPAAWQAEAAEAFLGAYRDAGPGTLEPEVAAAALRALVLDKALYEVVYESRHRPGWVHIPLAAIDRVLA